MRPLHRILLFLAISFLLGSCISQKSTIYMQDKGKTWDYANLYSKAQVITENYKIQTNDYLYIRVMSDDERVSAYYNLSGSGSANQQSLGGGGSSMKFMSYLVDDRGEIDMPSLGRIGVRGLTRSQIKEKISELLKSQISNYTLQVELTNAYFTILGEANAGLYQMPKDQMTIYEALAMSGDLSTYSKRKAIRIIRPTVEGVSMVRVVDITDKNLLDSQESYIYPNDMIYVEPIKAKMFGFGETFSLGLVTSLISFYLLIMSFN